MKLFFRITLACLVFTTNISVAKALKIHIAHGRFHDYYHMQFTLTPENCELTIPISERHPIYTESNTYTFAEGGQFEVFVRKSDFPIPSPGIHSKFLILRMPWTAPSYADSENYIRAKGILFDRIRKMKTKGKGSVEIIIELNPYITVRKKNPLKIELSGRNIFFRQAYGRYINYVGALKKE